MKNLSPFVVGVIVACVLLAAVAVLTFSGALPGFRGKSAGVAGNVTIWGSIDYNIIDSDLSNLNFLNKDNFRLVYVQKNADTIDQELTEALAEGRGPDLVILPHTLLSRHLNKIQPISYEVVSEQNFKQSFIPQGNLFLGEAGVLALPWYVDPLVLYYNDQILTSSGIALPPRFWVEIQSPLADGVLKKTTQLDELNNISQSTIALGQYNNINHAKDIIALLTMQSGDPIVGGVIDNNTTVEFGKGAQTALNFFIQFSDPAKEQYTWNSALPRSLDAFTSGKLAFYIGRASDLELIQKANPHLPFNAVVVPQIDRSSVQQTFGQLYGVSVLKASTKKTPATLAAIALTSGDFASAVALVNPLPSARRDVLSRGGGDNFKSVFNQSALISRGWFDPNPIETNIFFKEMVEGVLVGRTSIADAVSRVSGQMKAIK